MKILVTGAAGFIGFHLTKALLKIGYNVVGLDNINEYYDPRLKFNRLSELGIQEVDIFWNNLIPSSLFPKLKFLRINLEDAELLFSLCDNEKFDVIVNLAAQAGVRYSIDNPNVYIQSNIVGFINVLESARKFKVKHLVYASSSSVYGLNKKIPFSVNDIVESPISLYAATKKSNELMAYSYSHLFNLPSTGLRFFTVYGPFGRPDMAYYTFTKNILEGKPIDVFNGGNLERDFTYIDDVINGVIKILDVTPKQRITEQSSILPPYAIYNIGNNQPIKLSYFIESIERACNKRAIKNYLPHQPGDVTVTYADITEFVDVTGYRPNTSIEVGIEKFVRWYKNQYNG